MPEVESSNAGQDYAFPREEQHYFEMDKYETWTDTAATPPESESGDIEMFIARQQQRRMMTEGLVAEELSKIGKSLKEDASTICGSHEYWGMSYRKIFAILLFIERPSEIIKFIVEGLCDADLPLMKYDGSGQNSKTFSLYRKTAPSVSLKCFKGCKCITLKQFERYQWKLVAHFFSWGKDNNTRHWLFRDGVILPFINQEYAQSGAYGKVFKVKIHPKHLDFKENKVGLPLAFNDTS